MSVLYLSCMAQLRNLPCEVFTHLFSEMNPFWMPIALCTFLIGLIFYCYFGPFFNFSLVKNLLFWKKCIYRKLTRIVKLPFCHIFLLSVHIHTHFLILFLLTHLRANCRHHDFTLKCFSTYLLWTRIFSLKNLFYFIWTFLKTSSIQLSDWENLKLIQCYYLHSAIISPYSNSVLLVPSIL